MTTISFTSTPCELSLDVVRNNFIITKDTHDMDITVAIAMSYFKYHADRKEYKNAADLEQYLRSIPGASLGLIAIPWRKDPALIQAKEKYNGIIVRQDEMHFIADNTNVFTDDSKTDYVIRYSCRDRLNIIEETLRYSGTMEENLENLKTAGNVVAIPLPTTDADAEIDTNPENENDTGKTLIEKLAEGLIKLDQGKKMSHKEFFSKFKDINPDIELTKIAVLNDSTLVLAFTKNSVVTCRIGVIIQTMENGDVEKQYIDLTHLIKKINQPIQ